MISSDASCVAEMLRQKASVEDVKCLQDEKTNKCDTEQHMRCMEQMLKMLDSVTVLVAEELRLVANPKLLTKAER